MFKFGAGGARRRGLGGAIEGNAVKALQIAGDALV
jgi:hypothetical protein